MKHLTQALLPIQLVIPLFSLVSRGPDEIRVKGRVSADGILVMNQQDHDKLASKAAWDAVTMCSRSEVIPIGDLRYIGAKAAVSTLVDEFDNYLLHEDGRDFWTREVKDGMIFYYLKPKRDRKAMRESFDIFEL